MCVCVCVCSVAQLCPALHNPIDWSPPGSYVHYPMSWIIQARILEWVAISYSRVSYWPKNGTHVSYGSCIGRQILYHWATWDIPRLIWPTIKLEVWHLKKWTLTFFIWFSGRDFLNFFPHLSSWAFSVFFAEFLVVQGSAYDPIFLSMCIHSHGDLIQSNCFKYHLYADDC